MTGDYTISTEDVTKTDPFFITEPCEDTMKQQIVIVLSGVHMYVSTLNQSQGDTIILRPSHTSHKTTKNAVICHTHYNVFSQLQQFFQPFYNMGNNFYNNFF